MNTLISDSALKVGFTIFATGIALGSGPCLATCGPILLPFIAAAKKGPASSLKCWLIFSATKLFVYMILGGLAGVIGANLYQTYYWEKQGFICLLYTSDAADE